VNVAHSTPFNTFDYLSTPGHGRRLMQIKPQQSIFTQGSASDGVYYMQSGRAKLTVVSERGKEATITLLAPGDFVGEESIAKEAGQRLATATAISACTVLRIDRPEMLRVLHEEHAFSDLFLQILVSRGMRTQADLVDQLFNSSEKRLARILLLMSEFGERGTAQPLIPRISQEALAEMIGTTRSRVSFFMNRFREHGFVDYKYHGRIHVHSSLLKVVLNDRLPGHNAQTPTLARLSEIPVASVKKAY
jgi:CRP/FNR family cyclic AMP-dependent transcriptional regulator